MNGINDFMNNYNKFFIKSCRMCFLVKKDNIYLHSELNAKKISLRDKLYSCFPELDLRLHSNLILCLNCSEMINIVYEFICKYDKCVGQLHENFTFSIPCMPNLHLFNNFNATIKDEIKTEEVDVCDTEISLNMHEQIQNTNNIRKYLQNKMKMTVCTEEKPLKNSQCNDTIQKNPLKGYSSIDTKERQFKCPQCNYSCDRKSKLKVHIYTHTGEKPFKCSRCNYKCTLKSKLKIHFYTHTGEKPFKCSQCKYKCTQKPQLKLHSYTHTKEKPFKCSECNYKCAQKRQLKMHFYAHSQTPKFKVKYFKCSQCDYSSAYENNVMNHICIPTGGKSFK